MVYKAIQFKQAFGYDVEAASDEATLPASEYGESMTIQEHSIDADINELMRRFKVTGQLPQNVRMPEYGDYSEVGDYRSALHAVMAAQDDFLKLDAKVRAQFDNDPQLFLDFCSDPNNIDAMRAMGLAVPKETANGGDSGVDKVAGGEAKPPA